MANKVTRLPRSKRNQSKKPRELPIFALGDMRVNVYLHYVFDLWVEAWRKKVARGDVIVVRYADDLVVGFESRAEAERFLEEFRERLSKFGLELHAEKTRLIEFGRFAVQNREQRGEGKPETFTFLGFTHYCGKRRKDGAFIVWRETAKKRPNNQDGAETPPS